MTALIPQRHRGAKSPNDQVFQISLTELAFTIIFLLLLLSGLILNRKDGETSGLVKLNNRLIAERDTAIQNLEATQNAPAILEQLQSSREQLQETLNEFQHVLSEANVSQEDEIVSELVRRVEQNQEYERLKQKINDLNDQITSLQEIKQQLSDQPGLNGNETANNLRVINTALKFKKAFEDAVNEPIDEVHAEEKAHRYIREITLLKDSQSDTRSPQKLVLENKDLRGQVAWLQGRLNARGGRDFPPCWAEEKTGKPQYLFTIEMRDDGFWVAPAWTAEREQDAQALPRLNQVLKAHAQSISEFRQNVKDIHSESVAKNCRHYVRLINNISNLERFNRHRFTVEDYFYKFEVR